MKITYISTFKALAYYVQTKLDSTFISDSNYRKILNGIDCFCKDFDSKLKINGKKWTLQRYKSIYNGLKGFLFKTENFQQLLDPFIATTKQGYPKELSAIMHLIYDGSPGIRVVLTVCRIYESIILEATFDPSPIISGYNGKPLETFIKDFRKFVKSGMRKFGKDISSKLAISKLVSKLINFRFKSGPMGPSILTMHLDALALKLNHYNNLIFMEYCQLTSSNELIRLYELSYRNSIINVGNQHLLRTGKISLACEPAGKTRLFAICNGWVQSALKPLHDQLMKILRNFSTDGTYDQIGQFNRLINLSKGKKTYCFDLSKATDRFPIVLQQVLLEVIVSDKFAKAGVALISYLPFQFNNKSYIGRVGQPLGAYSSGAMFALTHHLFVQYCYYKAYNRIHFFNKYSLLGDDIVIGDTKVALYYQHYMSYIGVEINLSKSFIGLKASGEFAKRLFLNNQNISGFGFQMVERSTESSSGGIRFQEILISEGFMCEGDPLLLPGNQDDGLPKSLIADLNGKGALRNLLAQQLIIAEGNYLISYEIFIQYFIMERIKLLYQQTSYNLKYREFKRLTRKIQMISLKWGVTVKGNHLDISFINDELVSHPLLRYLNERNNLIFDKIELLNDRLKTGLFSTEEILNLGSGSKEEFIPSFKLDTFFVKNVNTVKFNVKTSTITKSYKSLMKAITDHSTEGENFQA